MLALVGKPRRKELITGIGFCPLFQAGEGRGKKRRQIKKPELDLEDPRIDEGSRHRKLGREFPYSNSTLRTVRCSGSKAEKLA